MKRILLITTGGTIASKASTSGLAPQLTGKEILSFVPEIAELAIIEVLALFNIDSTNMHPRHWIALASTIEQAYENYDAFVITHGTDTLAYTSAALTYLIQNSRKAIVLTGSQRSIAERDTDARKNIADSIRYATADDALGVKVVFDGQVLVGSRVRKTHTKSYRAFVTIDYPPVAVFRNNELIHYIKEDYTKECHFYHKLDEAVSILKLSPGLSPDILRSLATFSKAIVIEGFGGGGLPNLDEWNFTSVASSLIKDGVILVMSTQVQHEGSDMALYEVGHELKHGIGMLESLSMTSEALTVKLMWLLAQYDDVETVKTKIYERVDHDIL